MLTIATQMMQLGRQLHTKTEKKNSRKVIYLVLKDDVTNTAG